MGRDSGGNEGTKMTRKRVIWVGGGSRVAVMEWR